MNIELRKLLAQLQDARSKIDVWPDEFSREDTGAHVPSGYAPDVQAVLIESSSFATSLNSFHKLCLKTSFLPPEVQLETVMEIARKQFAGKIPLQVVDLHLLWAQTQFTAIRYRLARAVQPMGSQRTKVAFPSIRLAVFVSMTRIPGVSIDPGAGAWFKHSRSRVTLHR